MENPEVKIESVRITECPRDAMQGVKTFINTELKIEYLQTLLQVGFDVLDFGSFVSPKAVPQMVDTSQVIEKLDCSKSNTEMLAIVANTKGAELASQYDKIGLLGYPFSISETFQQRNTNSSVESSLETVENLYNLCEVTGKRLVVYISMAFGNPYGDFWDSELVSHWIDRILNVVEVEYILLADTVGSANAALVKQLYELTNLDFPKLEIGLHLHTRPEFWKVKLEAAYDAGCRRFDGAIQGFGGCPMASDELIGNMPTEKIYSFIRSKNADTTINNEAFDAAFKKAEEVFSPNS